MAPWTLARQAPLSVGDSAGKNTGMSCHALPPGDLRNQGIEPMSLKSPALTVSLSRAPPRKSECNSVTYISNFKFSTSYNFKRYNETSEINFGNVFFYPNMSNILRFHLVKILLVRHVALFILSLKYRVVFDTDSTFNAD